MLIEVFKYYNTSGAELICNICRPFVSTLCGLNRRISECEAKISNLDDRVAALEEKLQSNNNDFPTVEQNSGQQSSSDDLHGKFREEFEIESKKRNLVLRNFIIHNASSLNGNNDATYNSVCNFASQIGFDSNLIINAFLLPQRTDTENSSSVSLVRVSLKSVTARQLLLSSTITFLKTKPPGFDKVRVSLDLTYNQRMANRQLFNEVNSLKAKGHTIIKIDWRSKKVFSEALIDAQQPNLS